MGIELDKSEASGDQSGQVKLDQTVEAREEYSWETSEPNLGQKGHFVKMVSEVTYADIQIPPEERVCFTSRTLEPGERTTYAEVKVHWKSDSTSEAIPSDNQVSGCCTRIFSGEVNLLKASHKIPTMLKKILILPALLVLLMPPLIQAQEDLSGDKSEESGAFESGQASGELSGETSGEPNGQVSGELGWEPNGQPMDQSSLPDESSGSGSDLSYGID
ncbi:unnamed protein product [Caretta caretta]